MIAAGSGY